jgi:hypothetical protein
VPSPGAIRNAARPPGAAFFAADEKAAALMHGKTPLTSQVFKGLLPELRGRAFTVTGLAGLNEIARVRDQVADYARGQTEGGEAVTWDQAKKKHRRHAGLGK